MNCVAASETCIFTGVVCFASDIFILGVSFMKKLIISVVAAILAVGSVTVVVLGKDNKTVSKVYINDQNRIVVEYNDGTSGDFGKVETGKTIIDTEINGEKHLIVTYSDGTTEDLGYVGVQVGGGQTSTKVYTVTFVDANGNELSKQQVYQGLSAFAPEAPSIKNKVFAGWSKEFTNVQSDLTVQATYTNGQTYTVTFVDVDGNPLKTQEVHAGESAIAPTAPSIAGKVFNGWDKSYSNVTSNITIRATYREARNCVVTFKDYNGITLGTANVKEGGNATAPVTPSRDGYTFKSWSSSLNNVTGDMTVTAQYTINSANNIFDIAYKVNGNNVTVTLSLAGNVCLAGFEGTLSFEGMTLTTATAKSSNLTCNKNGNSVKMTYSNATNVTRGEVVLEVTLTKSADNGKATLNLTDCFDQNFATVSYKVIGQNLKLK
ncbi:MAG: hypothetical protein E7348_06230 [Clostridiales bacterium]|nr:hypothetical protein [Clostridiales bacterium]